MASSEPQSAPSPEASRPTFTIGGAIEYGWRATWRNFWPLLLVILVYVLINGAFSVVTGLAELPAPGSGTDGMDTLDALVATQVTVLSLAGSVVNFLVTTFLVLGLIRIALGVVQGRKVDIGDLFTFNGYGRYLLNTVIVGLIIGLALAIGLIPGVALLVATDSVVWLILGAVVGLVLTVVASLAFTFIGYVILDKNARGVSSLGASWALVRPHFWSILGLNLLIALIAVFLIVAALIIGLLMLIVGVLVTLPFAGVMVFGISVLSIAYAYRTISGETVVVRP